MASNHSSYPLDSGNGGGNGANTSNMLTSSSGTDNSNNHNGSNAMNTVGAFAGIPSSLLAQVTAAVSAASFGASQQQQQDGKQHDFGGLTAAQLSSLANTMKSVLPSSAPVSSLLPPLPHHHGTTATASGPTAAAAAAGTQAQQLLALFGSGAFGGASQAANALSMPTPTVPTAASYPLAERTTSNAATAAAAQLLLAQAAVASPVASVLQHTSMQNWSLEQLEQHVSMLHQLHQPVPQNITMLLSQARRQEEKRQAKRVANRRSACTSRARKKALVKEMTEVNAKLKRQALILALLPDLVIAIDPQGSITFCSAQVERVLNYGINDLIGVQLSEILAPASRDELQKLIAILLDADKASKTAGRRGRGGNSNKRKRGGSKRVMEEQEDPKALRGGKSKQPTEDETAEGSSFEATSSTVPAPVTDSSFPMSVVKVAQNPVSSDNTNESNCKGTGEQVESANADENEISDNSMPPAASGKAKGPSSLTDMTRSSTVSSLGNSGGSDDGARIITATKAAGAGTEGAPKGGKPGSSATKASVVPSCDTVNSSALSTDAIKLKQANANLDRNVRLHNQKRKVKLRAGYLDDVTGATVTANNATARLSSLQHRPEAASSEEDSGYFESNDSREETSSSSSDMSESNGKRTALAPTCNLCLVRDDLTTIWCEVTWSIRTRDPEPEPEDLLSEEPPNKNRKPPPNRQATTPPPSLASQSTSEKACSAPAVSVAPVEEAAKEEKEELKEILLCLRPMRENEAKVGEQFRFVPLSKKSVISGESNRVAASAEEVSGPSGSDKDATHLSGSSGVGEKRSVEHNDDTSEPKPNKRSRKGGKDIDTDVVESLMLMSNNQK